MSTLKNKIIENIPRDVSGARSANRFDYQKDWAICLLLKLYNEQSDFLLILDYHDDIVVLDSEINPSYCSFYQVKTKDNGVWKINDLIRKEGNNSILGKLYEHKIRFKDNVKELSIVSNAKIDVKLKNDKTCNELSKIPFSDLDEKEINIICNAIQEHYSLPESPELKDIMYFLYTDLSLHDHSNHVVGKIDKFINELEKKGNSRSFYIALHDELKRKNDREFLSDTWDNLKEKKAIGFNKFDNFIKSALKPDKYETDMFFAFNQLQHDGMDSLELRNLKTRYRTIEMESKYDGYLIINQNRKIVKEYVNMFKIEEDLTTFLKEKLKELKEKYPEMNSDDETIMIFLIEVYYGIY